MHPYCTSPFLNPTHPSVLPQSAVIDEQIPCLSADETITEGGKGPQLALCLTPKVGSGGQQKHIARHPNFRTRRCYCRVKHFPRYKTTEES